MNWHNCIRTRSARDISIRDLVLQPKLFLAPLTLVVLQACFCWMIIQRGFLAALFPRLPARPSPVFVRMRAGSARLL